MKHCALNFRICFTLFFPFYRDVGSIEAADSLLGHWLTKTDPNTFVKWVDTRLDNKRRLRPKKDLLVNQDSTDIFLPDNVNDRYPSRPSEMENMTLFDFMAQYDGLFIF